MTQALQLLTCIGVAALIGVVSLFVDRWEKSNETKSGKLQHSFDFPDVPASEGREEAHKGAAMSRIG